ncbi:MAG: hypothetical protein JWP52_224 [Rhizobacter sp.]|nr:hypothetical protein [Rhizobacter sp.]
MKFALLTSAALLAFMPLASEAVQIQSQYTHLSGTSWQLDLTLVNDDNSLGSIGEFSVYFPRADFVALDDLSTPASWDPFVAEPNASPSDGYVDYLAFMPLGVNQSQGGFSIGFTYLGSGTPGSLAFDIINPDPFTIVYSGQTVIAAVPEPETNALLLAGFGLLAWQLSSRKGRASACKATVAEAA